MTLEYVSTTTADGLRLDAVLKHAEAQIAPANFDAVIAVHGSGDGFHRASILDNLSQFFSARGVAFLRVNTRGSGLVTGFSTAAGVKIVGSAYETLDKSVVDLEAWLVWARQRGFQRICLLGHSLGGLKSLYTAAALPGDMVQAVVALSPPRLSHSYLARSRWRESFASTYDTALRMDRQGFSQELINVTFPLKYISSPASYLDKYAPDEKYNLLAIMPQLPCPALLVWGSEEVAKIAIFADLPEDAARAATSTQATSVQVVTGGNHHYRGVREATLSHIDSWLHLTPPKAGRWAV